MQWFRWYHGTATDMKFGRIARQTGQTKERVVFVWAMLLESASESEPRGRFEVEADDIADVLNCETEAISSVMDALAALGMIEGNTVTAWESRQPSRDDSTSRQRKRRAGNAHVTRTPRDNDAAVTPPETESDTETDVSPDGDTDARASPDEISEAVERYNAVAEQHGLARVQKVTKQRRAKLKARLKDCGGLDGWDAALGKLGQSPFLLGKTKDFRATFDFLIREASFTRLMEGSYDGRKPGADDGDDYRADIVAGLGLGSDPGEHPESGSGDAGEPAGGGPDAGDGPGVRGADSVVVRMGADLRPDVDGPQICGEVLPPGDEGHSAGHGAAGGRDGDQRVEVGQPDAAAERSPRGGAGDVRGTQDGAVPLPTGAQGGPAVPVDGLPDMPAFLRRA